MKIESFSYTIGQGWSITDFPKLDSKETLILVFAAPEIFKDTTPIKELSKQYPNSHIVGCSGAGEISGDKILDNGMSVAITKFEKTKIQVARVNIEKAEDSYEVGQSLAKKLEEERLSNILVFSDGLKVNGSELAKGLNTLSDDKIIITGGLAGDGDRFEKTWVIHNGQVFDNSIIGVGFYGDDVEIGYASRGGWDKFGPERRITSAKGNVLYELDGKPALSLYKEYLGDRASGLPSTGLLFPLAIRKNAQDDSPVVRTILAVNEEDQSLTFAGDMPVGYMAQLMRANFDRLINSAGEAGEIAKGRFRNGALNSNEPVLSIAISCVGRRLLLGERTEEETEAILANLPMNTHQVGFYSYGELSPFVAGNCDLHNQTMTVTTIGER